MLFECCIKFEERFYAGFPYWLLSFLIQIATTTKNCREKMVLMYHNVVPTTAPAGFRFQCITLSIYEFSRQIRWLMGCFEILSLHDYLGLSDKERSSKKYAALTFDDTTEITVDCVGELINQKEIPVTYFVTSEQVNGGPLFWCAYLNAICYEDLFQCIDYDGVHYSLDCDKSKIRSRNELMQRAIASGDPISYCLDLRGRLQIPDRIMKYYQGISFRQLAASGKCRWTEIAGHTVRHPILPQLSLQEQREEIEFNKRLLEAKSAQTVRYMAYPFGDYDKNSIRVAKECGFKAAFTVNPKGIGENRLFEYPRVGAYTTRNLIIKSLLYKSRIYARHK